MKVSDDVSLVADPPLQCNIFQNLFGNTVAFRYLEGPSFTTSEPSSSTWRLRLLTEDSHLSHFM